MPRTEAGKRLNDVMGGDCADLIDAIEAEACHHDARWIEQFTAWCVAAERARIRAAVGELPLATWERDDIFAIIDKESE